MKLHVLGVCGTFMAGIALLAKERGHEVVGSDLNVYPPMSTQLEEQGIQLYPGYDPAHITKDVDCVVVGNVIKRGNPAIEYVLANQVPYCSGPQWLSENVLRDRHVLAVAGTHGKTTTASLLAWILEHTGNNPGFLIGGIPENFGMSARLGESSFFVIEADEYDCAFFDKRSKFIHYKPKTLILNNLEYDHADIFPDLAAIKQQFHYLLRTIPGNGKIIYNQQDQNLKELIEMGVWTPLITFGGSQSDWQAVVQNTDGSTFEVKHQDHSVGTVHWDLLGRHNVSNALAALAAVHSVGVPVDTALTALSSFKNVKRRLEIKGRPKNISVYDDFAHHPTAIETTLAGLRARIGKEARLIAVVEFGSYTMRAGVHKSRIKESLRTADMVVCKNTDAEWGLKQILSEFEQPTAIYNDVDTLVSQLAPQLQAGDHVIIMSNSGFGGIHNKLIAAIEKVEDDYRRC